MRINDTLSTGPRIKRTEEIGKDYDFENKAKPTKPMTLSVACITKGEGSLHEMLASIKDIADEIVLVFDPKHKEEMEKYADFKIARFIEPWKDDFAAAKNFAFSKCSSDWILWLDSDDIVPEKSAQLIRSALDNPGPLTQRKACFFNLQLQMTAEYSHPTGICQPRLTPNLPEIKWVGRIHETHAQSLIDLKLEPVTVDNIFIVHSGYDTIEKTKEKVRTRNLPMLEKEPNSPHRFYHLGQSNMILEKWSTAYDWFSSALQEYKTLKPEFEEQIMFSMAICKFRLDKGGEASFLFRRCKNIPESVYYCAVIRAETGDEDEGAIRLFEEYLNRKTTPSFWGTNRLQSRYDAYNQIACIYMKPLKEVQQRARKEFPSKPAWNK